MIHTKIVNLQEQLLTHVSRASSAALLAAVVHPRRKYRRRCRTTHSLAQRRCGRHLRHPCTNRHRRSCPACVFVRRGKQLHTAVVVPPQRPRRLLQRVTLSASFAVHASKCSVAFDIVSPSRGIFVALHERLEPAFRLGRFSFILLFVLKLLHGVSRLLHFVDGVVRQRQSLNFFDSGFVGEGYHARDNAVRAMRRVGRESQGGGARGAGEGKRVDGRSQVIATVCFLRIEA
mmetsp:Transcript_7543/g.17096  ORF Transcript_7543/g.17096 Transcript_7543/m.17096 type:complete len:232 (-) Transcript_7543:136-831(-)